MVVHTASALRATITGTLGRIEDNTRSVLGMIRTARILDRERHTARVGNHLHDALTALRSLILDIESAVANNDELASVVAAPGFPKGTEGLDEVMAKLRRMASEIGCGDPDKVVHPDFGGRSTPRAAQAPSPGPEAA